MRVACTTSKPDGGVVSPHLQTNTVRSHGAECLFAAPPISSIATLTHTHCCGRPRVPGQTYSDEERYCSYKVKAKRDMVDGQETWLVMESTLEHTCSARITFSRSNLTVHEYMPAVGGVASSVAVKGSRGVILGVSQRGSAAGVVVASRECVCGRVEARWRVRSACGRAISHPHQALREV